MRGLLDPKVDFVFKNIFGSPKHPRVLISFLNATLNPINKITSVEIKGTDLEKQFIDDKYSRLDIKAVTNANEIINIEIQLKNEYNMVKRSIYYLSKMYEEQLKEGEDYSSLNRTVCINILNFKYLNTEEFHTGYRLKEIKTNKELTDVIEIHFIEIPKLPKESDEKDMLSAWTEFLRNPESEKVRSLEMSIEEIREAKDDKNKRITDSYTFIGVSSASQIQDLERHLSNDEKQRELYEMRSKILKDKVSALNEAERKGIEKGIEKGKKEGIREGENKKAIEIARNLLDVLDNETISIKTGLTIEEIENLR